MTDCETELEALRARERRLSIALALSFVGSATLALAALRRTGRVEQPSKPSPPPEPPAELGQWYRVEDRLFVDEPFVRLAINKLRANTARDGVEFTLPALGRVRLQRISFGRVLPEQQGALYEVERAPGRPLEVLQQLELLGALRRAGDYLDWPEQAPDGRWFVELEGEDGKPIRDWVTP